MHKKEQVLQALPQQKLLPLYYHNDAGVSVAIMQALYEAGIRVIEYTNRGGEALNNFKALKEAAQKLPGMLLGIGTIKNAVAAQQFIDAGADFIICPSMNDEVADTTYNAGLLWIPGCMTPTEIASAEASGASIVKIFPGNILGPGYINAIKELFPDIKFIPTGGVEAEAENLRAWFKAGVIAVGMGSKLITAQRVQQKDYEGIRDATEKALQLVAEAKMQTA